MVLVIKNLPANAGDLRYVGLISGWEDSPGEGYGTHVSILAWEIPRTEESGWLHSHKEWDMTERLTVSGNQSQTLLG